MSIFDKDSLCPTVHVISSILGCWLGVKRCNRVRAALIKLNGVASSCSPYVTKVETWLRFNNFKYTKKLGNLMKAPFKKLPCIVHNGQVIPDSNFIIRYLKNTFPEKVAKLSPEQEALSTVITQFCHQHFCGPLIGNRWIDDEGFKTCLNKFFTFLPLPLQILVPRMARKKVEAAMKVQGWGDLPPKEQQYILERDAEALSVLLGDKPFLTGDLPSEADAALFGYLDNMLYDGFTPNCAAVVRRYPNLVAFTDRIRSKYYPEIA
eukprot:jgi/Botrbrau1/17004/Bobra.49_2s0063.2